MAARKEVQIFNFAFLDILTSTLGALLFIFVMALVNQFGLIEQRQKDTRLDEARKDRDAAKAAAETAQQNYVGLLASTQQIGQHTTGVVQEAAMLLASNQLLEARIEAVRNQTEILSNQTRHLQQKLAGLKSESARLAGAKMMLPVAQGGSGGASPVHVDCTKDGVVMLGEDITRRFDQRSRCSEEQIEQADSPYRRFLGTIKPPVVLVLWIRPDGIKSFEKALKLAKEAGVAVGYEPAEPDWSF